MEPVKGQHYVWDEESRTWVAVAETPNKWIPSPQLRRWIFAILASIGPVLVFYGLATSEEIALWLGIGGTILGTPAGSLAARNVPTKAE